MAQPIHHIVLTVSNLKESTDFYKKVLGWKILDTDNKEWSALGPKEGQHFLWIGTPRDQKKPKNKFNRNNVGLDHFSFEIKSLSELKKIEQRLKKGKIKMDDDGITDDGFKGMGIFCYDPDGMKVEFHLKK